MVEEGFLPIVSDIPGFVAYYWVDGGGGTWVSMSVFQNRAGAEESNRRSAAFVRERMSKVLPNPPQITAGEVIVTKALGSTER
jgi:hypothetical protein